MGVGGHDKRWHAVTCTKAKPPSWRHWEDLSLNQGDLGWVIFFNVFAWCH